MKRIIACFALMAVIAACLSSCSAEKKIVIADEGHTEYEGIFVTLDSVSYSDGKPVFNVTWHNETDISAEVESWCVIQYKSSDSVWGSTNFCGADVIREESPIIELQPKSDYSHTYNLWPYKLDRRGSYRIKGTFSVEAVDAREYYSAVALFEYKRA